MKIFKSLIACVSTYSKIPMPHVDLDSDDFKYALIFYPLIGAFIGAIEYVLFYSCEALLLPKMFRVLLMAVIPLIITGGIHVDGFMDTSDAFCSYGDKDRKLSIMKDPNTGAFAVINLAIFSLLFLAFSYLINTESVVFFCFSFVIARALSGICAVTIKPAKEEGMLNTIKKNTQLKVVFIVLIFEVVLSLALVSFIKITVALMMLLFSFISYFTYKSKMMKELNGITGDTLGYYMCITELILIIISSVGGYI